MSQTDFLNELSSKIAGIINSHDDWTEEDNQRIQSEYMKILGGVWNEVVNTAAQESQQHPKEDAETMEDVEIRHEGTLIAVTKKRKEYPAYIAALLGKKTRLKKNTAEVLKVSLPPRALIEVDGGVTQLDEKFNSLVKDTMDTLSENTKSIQQHTHHLMQVADAAEVIVNNQYHPTEALITSQENCIMYSR
ncbi:uncharacterized protein LOC121857862 [Homarus americanus]|uniref:Uncharacterized protein n=1 Tax=Homarus americanus TaxID=6706 RepID=A0A8J5NEF0_HOMAM|nr:uncharacterized protein LOC121857862 [Homarus americanus]KAG7178009.1 hypothetical protein Hamer_G003757 [Homarus americanus]